MKLYLYFFLNFLSRPYFFITWAFKASWINLLVHLSIIMSWWASNELSISSIFSVFKYLNSWIYNIIYEIKSRSHISHHFLNHSSINDSLTKGLNLIHWCNQFWKLITYLLIIFHLNQLILHVKDWSFICFTFSSP